MNYSESRRNLDDRMEQQDDDEMETSKVEVDDFISTADVDEKRGITDSEDHVMSDVSGTLIYLIALTPGNYRNFFIESFKQ